MVGCFIHFEQLRMTKSCVILQFSFRILTVLCIEEMWQRKVSIGTGHPAERSYFRNNSEHPVADFCFELPIGKTTGDQSWEGDLILKTETLRAVHTVHILYSFLLSPWNCEVLCKLNIYSRKQWALSWNTENLGSQPILSSGSQIAQLRLSNMRRGPKIKILILTTELVVCPLYGSLWKIQSHQKQIDES